MRDCISEIERMTEQAIHFRDLAQRQGALLIRAADALELAISHYGTEYEQQLIAELREAAE